MDREMYAKVMGYLLHTGGATVQAIKRDVTSKKSPTSILKAMLADGVVRLMFTGGWKKPQPDWQGYGLVNWTHKGSTYPRECWYVPTYKHS